MVTISTKVTKPVVFGQYAYTGALQITATGAVAPATYAREAIYVGADLGNKISIVNDGQITGSAAVYKHHEVYGPGGAIGVYSPIFISNEGTITGGGFQNDVEGDVRTAVSLNAGAILYNKGLIQGDNVGSEVDFAGGNALSLNNSYSTNKGILQGGSGGSYGGVGVSLDGHTIFTNEKKLYGGYGGAHGGIGIDVAMGSAATNTGTIVGGASGIYGGSGALVTAGGKLTNNATIIGGALTARPYRENAAGAAISLEGGILVNAGLLQGGGAVPSTYGPVHNGAGLYLQSGTVTNTGHITGGSTAIAMAGGTLTNAGQIIGGTVGVDISGGTLTNTGRIIGTLGIDLSGGTLTTSGAITSNATTAPVAILVNPTDTTATLIIDPGAIINGTVQANPGGIAILELAGNTAGKIGQIGTAFTGFDIIEVATRSSWTFQQADTIAATTSLLVNGSLTVSGLLQDAGALDIRSTGTLTVASGGSARANIVNLQGGTLAGATGGRLAIGNNVSASQPGALTIDAGGKLSGYGIVTAPGGVLDTGLIVATQAPASAAQPALDIASTVTGTGHIAIDSHATLQIGGNLTVASLAFAGPGELDLATAQPTPAQITAFSTNDTIGLYAITANTETYANGVLSLYNNGALVDQLNIAGDYTTANFTLTEQYHNADYTAVSYAPNTTAQAHTETRTYAPLTSQHLHFDRIVHG